MQPLKQEALETLQCLPDDINDIDAIMDKLRKGREYNERWSKKLFCLFKISSET